MFDLSRRSFVQGLMAAGAASPMLSACSTTGGTFFERDWFGQLLGSGWRDLLREHVGPRKGPYSWWSNRGQARALDRGWRIDYLLGNAAARARICASVCGSVTPCAATNAAAASR